MASIYQVLRDQMGMGSKPHLTCLGKRWFACVRLKSGEMVPGIGDTPTLALRHMLTHFGLAP